MMKILFFSLLLLCLGICLRPPAPYCRVSPLPSMIPIAINTTIRYDVQTLFDGYNLEITGPKKDHIHITPKYEVYKSDFDHSFNFTTAKIKMHNRFLGLIVHDFESTLVIGTNDQNTGVKVEKLVQIQDIPHMHCYDVDQIYTRDQNYAVIDCATFNNGGLETNHFIYVNLATGVKVLGGKTSDSFVKYSQLSKRNIQVIQDPFNRILYILRIIPRDGVDQEHKNQTYIQLFMIRNAIDPQIIDVIDHTLIQQKSFSIADYQVIFGQIYVLDYNRGLYEFTITRDQKIQIRSFFEIKMNMHKFRVDRIGFNDDLFVAITNGNQVYTYNWDLLNPPKLIQKYGLPANSHAEQIVCNTDFVIVTAITDFESHFDRKHWVFTKRSTSYTHAYNVFDAPEFGPAIMQLQGNDRTLHLFHEYNSYNIKMSLPYMQISPVMDSYAGTKQTYTITATSLDSSDSNNNITCESTLTFIYQAVNDSSIIKTGFMDKLRHVVDSPDQLQLDLTWQFYGRNLSYDITFQVNSSLIPHAYVDKIHQALFRGLEKINPENIVFFQVFEQATKSQLVPESVYSLVQVIDDKTATIKSYTTHYIHCRINVVDRDDKHHLTCEIISSTRFGMGRIIQSSQMFDIHQRRIALVFDTQPNVVMIYYLWQAGFGFFGRKVYAEDPWNILSGVTISKGRLFCTLQNSKRIQIFNIQDLRQRSSDPVKAQPIFVINSQIMRFFGVQYWAPVNTKVSPFHDQVLFVKTKTGVMAINVNEDAMPELLFQIQTLNIKYDFQVNQQNLIIIHEAHSQIWHLYTPLRRSRQPFLREYVNYQFKLGEYDEITSDKLFYIVGNNDVIAINPRFTNNNAIYVQIRINQQILNLDAVNIRGRQLLFIHTVKQIYVYVIRQTPKLYINWPAHQHDFNLSLTASNPIKKSQPYNWLFQILDTNQTQIKPTQHFNHQQIKKIGHVRVHQNQNKTFTFNVTFNDTEWFQGNVFHYTLNCSQCKNKQQIRIQNHVEQVGELVLGRAIYDIESNFDGIYAQQYSSYFKTFSNNDSIEYIQNIPTVHRGQVCSKMALDNNREYVVSLCETGGQVNVYITSLISDKPFTMGPYATEAKAVNHAKVVDDILMIVDNEDDPFIRNGRIYLYSLVFTKRNQFQMTMIDLVDNEDLSLQGYHGMGNIGSADLHDSHGVKQYRLFITDTLSGNLFFFSFQLTPDRQQIVYLSKKLVKLSQTFPKAIKAPTPLRILTVSIHHYISYPDKDNLCQYYLLFTTANWHHFQLLLTVDKYDNVKTTKLLRMFERIPWTLINYVKMKRAWNASQFAVPYVDYENNRQVVAIYQADMIVAPVNVQQQDQQSYQLVEVPLIGILGVHRVRDTYEVAFGFHSRGLNTLLFTDFDGYNITQLKINPNITLYVENLAQPENVSITAHNPYSNFTFNIQVQYIDQDQQERIQIVWYVIVGLAAFMIIGLIIVYGKQKSQAKKLTDKSQKSPILKGKQSLITVDDKFKDQYINRTSVDPESVRNTVDYGLTDSLLADTPKPTPSQTTEEKMTRNEE